MLATRVIPLVLYDGTEAVVTMRFSQRRNAGSVVAAARLYASRNVDEIVFLDIGARRHGRGPDLAVVRAFADVTTAPFAVGGGVRSLSDALALLAAGADKVVVGAVEALSVRPELVGLCAARLGAQAVIVTVDAEACVGTGWRAWDAVARRPTGNDVIEAARWLAAQGAGEVLLQSVDRDGARTGYDCALIGAVARAVDVPVIAAGGCGSPSHAVEAIRAGAHAVAASAMFCFSQHRPRDVARALGEAGYPVRSTARKTEERHAADGS